VVETSTRLNNGRNQNRQKWCLAIRGKLSRLVKMRYGIGGQNRIFGVWGRQGDAILTRLAASAKKNQNGWGSQ